MPTATFLELVCEAKNHLQQEGGADFETLCLLTSGLDRKSEHKEHAARYSAMWKSLERRTPADEKQDYHWVLWFARAVTRARQTPSFHYKNAKDRQDIIHKIEKHTKALANLYSQNGLDVHWVYNKDAFLDGFFIYEDLDEIYQAHVDTCFYNRCPTRGCHHNRCQFENCEKNGCPAGGGNNERIAFTKIIKAFAQRSIANISAASGPGKADNETRVKIRHFIRSLSRYTKENYDRPLLGVLSTAVFAIYDQHYSEQQISLLLNR